MFTKSLGFGLILVVGTALADVAETFNCRAGGAAALFNPDWEDNILLVATVNEDRTSGTIQVAGITHNARYWVEGIDRRWNWGDGKDWKYSFIIKPDGSAAYYDLSHVEPGESTGPRDFFVCEDELKQRKSAELERQRADIERERQREIERQRAERERQRRIEEEAALAEMAAYRFALVQKVLRNWARPASARAELDCLVAVRQTATGDVISADVVSCNGDAATERSIEAAVKKASPLPVPDNPVLFDPNLRFRFIP
jgi:hypothetical protein